MSRGALLFAFNNTKHDYYAMAEATAIRINHFLNLPVTVVTNPASFPQKKPHPFDKVMLVEADKNNIREKNIWINKGRYQAYEFSPYDETLLLDTDYMVNSDKLTSLFGFYDDFCCHNTTSFLMSPNTGEESLSTYSFNTLWATAVLFRKSRRAEQIFQCLEMIQNNYEHYGDLYGFIGGLYRNDYALSIALRIVNGHSIDPQDFIPWNLLHIGQTKHVHAVSDAPFNTEFMVMHDVWKNNKIRKEYVLIKDTDFHMIDKVNFMEVV